MKFYSPGKNIFLDGKYKETYLNNNSWPDDSIPVNDEIFNEFSLNTRPVGKIRVAGQDGMPKWEDIPKPTNKEIFISKIAIVQKHMDDAARVLNYDDIKTAVTYADEPAVPKFQNEGRVFREWRSLVWEKCYTILAEVEAGNRVIPTDDELIAELPKINL